jgi:pimeloyl-ACP methyl ester carboxylesterase
MPMMISKNFSVNGAPQWLYLHFCQRPKATLLFIHGGPGWPDAPWAGVVCQKLWNDFNIIHWDQRGSNRSYTPNQAPFNIDQLIEDGLEVCRILRDEFKIEQPVLIGHSWGAFLAVLMAARGPELFQRYIGIGQLVDNSESEKISLEFCKRKAKALGRGELLTELNAMPERFYESIPLLFREREIVGELGGEFLNPPSQKELERWILQSPLEYQSKWEDLYEGCKTSCETLWPELIKRSLFKEVHELKLPVALLQGRHDYCTPAAPIERWLSMLSCPGKKELIWFENSAHWPQIEENKKFADILLGMY